LQESAQVITDDAIQIVVKALIDLCTQNTQTSGFQFASTVSTDTEDLLVDGAIDQTFAFQRSQFIQLNAGRVELSDKL